MIYRFYQNELKLKYGKLVCHLSNKEKYVAHIINLREGHDQ